MPALVDPHHEGAVTLTYKEAYATMQDLAAGLADLGLRKGDKVGLFSENSHRWAISDGAILMAGGVDVVRGASAPAEELQYILGHSGSTGLVVQDAATLDKVLASAKAHEGGVDALAALRFVVVMWGEPSPAAIEELTAIGVKSGTEHGACAVLSYQAVLARGRAAQQRDGRPYEAVAVDASDLATLVYTSGTTGHPKGVMLTHANLVYQVCALPYFIDLQPGQAVLSLLPPWHIYERTCSYLILSRGCRQVYSSIRKLKDDLAAVRPDHFVCVPLVLDTLHARVMQRLKAMPPLRAALANGLLAVSAAYIAAKRVVDGVSLRHAMAPPSLLALGWATLVAKVLAPLHALATKLVYGKVRDAIGIQRTIISGGGSLASHLDTFYEVIGLPVLNGWGLTETSPVIACRRDAPLQNVRGSVGTPTPGTQVRVVDPDTLADLPNGRQGLVLAKGPGVMQGYYRDAAATAKVFRAGGGWFDTGDLGWRAPGGVARSEMAGQLVLSGRAKDTLVLTSGKNVEPQPIEDACLASRYIKHIMLLGQDKRELGALVWVDQDYLASLKEAGAEVPSGAALEQLISEEVTRLNTGREDYHPYEHISHVVLAGEPLSVDSGTLTRTMKLRRPQVAAAHAAEAAALLGKLRG